MLSELKLLRYKQYIFNYLIKYDCSTSSPNKFLLWYSNASNDERTRIHNGRDHFPIQYNNMIDALNNNDESLVMEYISNFSEKELSDLHNFFLTELVYQRKVYLALISFQSAETPDKLLKMYLDSTTPDEWGIVRSETDRITFLHLLTALNEGDVSLVIEYISHLSDMNLYYILDFFKPTFDPPVYKDF